MSLMSWVPQMEDGLAKGLTAEGASKSHQEPLNLYVHPEPSPELEERLLRDSAAPSLQAAKTTDGTARSLDSQPSGSLELRKDYNYEAQPCLASSPSAVQRDPRVFTLSTAGRSSDSYDGQHSSLMGCSDSHSLHLGGGNTSMDQERSTECNVDFRQRVSMDTTAAAVVAAQQPIQSLDHQQQLPQEQIQQQQRHEQPSSSERAWPQAASLHQNPDGDSAAPLPSSFEPMQALCGGCKSPSTCPTRQAPAGGGELVSVHSLSLSGPDRDLLDQLLGSEPGASSPPLVTPSSFLAAGPFGDASLQPAFSDYSQRPTPAQHRGDHLDAEADSALPVPVHQNVKSGGVSNGGGAQPQPRSQPLPSAYSEPAPFSTAPPLHSAPALHPRPSCPSVGALSRGGRPPAAGPLGGGAAAAEDVRAAQYQQQQQQGHKGAGAEGSGFQRWPGGQGGGCSGYEPGEPGAPPQQQQQMQQQQQQQQQMQQQQQVHAQQQQQQMPQQRARSATHVSASYCTSQPMSLWDEPGLLAPAHSAPVQGLSSARQSTGQPGGLASSGGAASPMHLDAPSRPHGYAPFSNGAANAAAAANADSAMDVGAGAPLQPAAAACANPASSAGGPYPVPLQCSPSDSRGKRLRPHTAEGRPAAASVPTAAVSPPAHATAGPPPPQPSASAGGGSAAARASSPSSQSAGDPMSVSGMEGAAMYGQGPGYPYPYSMPPPYSMSYGMPYGDPYYHPGYGYHPMMDAPPPPPPGGPDSMAAGYGGPPHNPQLHYPHGYMAPRQRLYRRFVSGGPHGRRDGSGQPLDAPPAAAQGQEGPMPMGSGPAGSAGAAPPPAMHAGGPPARQQQQQPAPSSSAAAAGAGARQGYQPGARPGGAASCGGGGAAAAMDMQCAGPADQASAGGAVQGHVMQMQAGTSRAAPGGPPAIAAAEMDVESSMAARACHEQFASDDMALPLPRSTVDGIRQELRVVTQEFLQRRMDLARSKQLAAAAAAAANGDAGQARLQPSNSWAAGDTMSSMSVPTAPATAPFSHQYNPHQYHHPQHSGMPPSSYSADGFSQGMALAYPSSAAAGGGGGGGLSTTASLPHKRGASAGLSAGGGAVSPVRARPAPSAPTAAHSAPLASVRGAAASGLRRSAEGFACDTVTGGAPLQSVASEPCGGTCSAGPGPSAMRQLFPPPAPGAGAAGGGAGYFGNGVCGPGASYGAPGGGAAGKPPQSAPAVSAPLGPRPAMSGKSSASATHSVSVAQTAPLRGGMQQQQQLQQQQQQQQQKGPRLMAMGSYRVGQQGSMAAEVEDDGEEVHGPPQRSGANRPVVPPAAVSSSACGPPPPSMPMPPSYYGGAVPPPPYDYPSGYYYPPSMPTYGMRMYGMPPPPSMPPGYRPPSGSGVPMYGMPPPSMPYTAGGAVPLPWSEYGAPPMPGGPMPQSGPGAPMTHGSSSGGMPSMVHLRGGAATGGGSTNEYMQSAAGR